MTTGSSNTKPFSKWFQVRWAEKLGDVDNPYLIRWTFIFFGYSIRIHHWLRSDDRRFFHDHSSDLLSIVLKGFYFNVVPIDPKHTPDYIFNNKPKELIATFVKATKNNYIGYKHYLNQNIKLFYVEGMFNSWYNFIHCFKYSIWFSKAEQQHYLHIPSGGAWTLLFEGRKRIKWGFFTPRYDKHHKLVNNGEVKKMRPIRFFKTYGIIQADKTYQ